MRVGSPGFRKNLSPGEVETVRLKKIRIGVRQGFGINASEP